MLHQGTHMLLHRPGLGTGYTMAHAFRRRPRLGCMHLLLTRCRLVEGQSWVNCAHLPQRRPCRGTGVVVAGWRHASLQEGHVGGSGLPALTGTGITRAPALGPL